MKPAITQNRQVRKLKYRNDAEYRAIICGRAKAHRDRCKACPQFRALEVNRKAIYRTRESYHARLAHAERLFAKLEALLKQQPKLITEWRKARAKILGRSK